MEQKYVVVNITKGGMDCKNGTNPAVKSASKKWGIKILFAFVIAAILIRPVTIGEDFSDGTFQGVTGSSFSVKEINAIAEIEEDPVLDIVLDDQEPVLPDPENSIAILESLDVPTDENANKGIKTYMSYKAITSPSSTQYAMQQDAWTDENGFRRYGDYYMVALGTFYAKSCGETFLITLDSGISFKVITGDIKADKDTDSLHQHRNGNIVEFIVDSNVIPRMCRVMGDMSYTNNFSGKIAAIDRIADIADT